MIGHSLGAIKSIIYQGTRQRSDVVGIVSCSAPQQFYSERVARQAGFRELIDKAEALVADGKGEELMIGRCRRHTGYLHRAHPLRQVRPRR